MRILFTVVCLASLTQLAFPQSPSSAKPLGGSSAQHTAEQELLRADIEFCRQTAARRLDGWMDAFAPDAAVMHDGATVSGTEALRKYYEPVFANKDFTLTWTPTNAEASQDGTSGYTYGTYEAKRPGHVSHGMYLTIWRKINGHWKVVMDTGSPAPDPPANATRQ